MFVVVLCHGTTATITREKSPVVWDCYMLLHLFVMPTFVVLTGFFAKGMAKAGNPKRMRILNIAVMYAITQILKILLVPGSSFFVPQYGNWYLSCMIIWYAALPGLSKFKPWIIMVGSIMVALLVGVDTNKSYVLRLYKLVCFTPFFMLGYYIPKARADVLKLPAVRRIGAVLLLFVSLFCLLIWNDASPTYDIAFADYNYEYMGLSNLAGMGYRLVWYILAVALGFGVMCVIPRKNCRLTVLGTRTLPIFIIHTVVYHYLSRKTTFFQQIAAMENVGDQMLLILCLSVFVVLFCGNKYFSKAFDWLMTYDFKALMKKEQKIEV